MKKKTTAEFEGTRPKKSTRVMTESFLVNYREDVKEEDQKNGTV